MHSKVGASLGGCRLSGPVQRAERVAVGVAQIGQVELARRAFTKTRRVFTGSAAVGNAGRVKGVGLLRRHDLETNGAAIAMAGRLAVKMF